MNVLVTGGAGYIGSHAAMRLLADGHAVTVVDDLSRGNLEALEILRPLGDLEWEIADVGDLPVVIETMRRRSVDAVMHFAALAYVGESVRMPLAYHRANAAGTLSVLEAMSAAGVRRIVFSSTCATYGTPPPEEVPIRETCPQHPINPYGRAKRAAEEMIRDHAGASGGDFACTLLRYFNVAGSDGEGRIGECHAPETHLIPICLQVALGLRDAVTIYGTDYDTPDGTCLRDYVHVDDLISAHVTALDALAPGDERVYNVGIGSAYSVRQVVEACRRVTGEPIASRDGDRRPGDPSTLYADPTRIRDELGWRPDHTDLDAIVETAWRWMREHPQGY